MLLKINKKIRGGICPAIDQYAKVNNKYIKHKNNEWSYLKYWDVINLNL